jgi:hypothetical protein
VRGLSLGASQPAKRAKHSLELGSGGVFRELEKVGLRGGLSDPGEDSHLGVAQTT